MVILKKKKKKKTGNVNEKHAIGGTKVSARV